MPATTCETGATEIIIAYR